jgi:type IV pilus assembly protein PilB
VPEQAELVAAGFPESQRAEIGELFRAAGCSACSNTGFRGRLGLYEVMPMSEEIQRMTVERASSDQIKTMAVQQGMITLREDGLTKTVMGLTRSSRTTRSSRPGRCRA